MTDFEWQRFLRFFRFGTSKTWGGHHPAAKEVCRIVRSRLSYQQRQGLDRDGLCVPSGPVPWRMKIKYPKVKPVPKYWWFACHQLRQ
jgi:hypothetical protein